jgi:HEAT repeat protein
MYRITKGEVMEIDGIYTKPVQPVLFELGEDSSGIIELFPGVWHLAEMAISQDTRTRWTAVTRLHESRAVRLLPLITYLLATRITDPDLEIRSVVIKALADVLSPDEQGRLAPESVRQCLKGYLAQIRTRWIYSMVQILPVRQDLEGAVANLLNACPYAGNQLADILASRKVSLDIRRYAARMIGLVGYLESIPALERLLARLESRARGQQSMSFAPVEMTDEADLIPDIRRALAFLNSP